MHDKQTKRLLVKLYEEQLSITNLFLVSILFSVFIVPMWKKFLSSNFQYLKPVKGYVSFNLKSKLFVSISFVDR